MFWQNGGCLFGNIYQHTRKHVDLFENLCGFLENEEHLENVGFRFVCLIFGNIYHHMRKQDLFENLCKFWH